MKITIKNYGQTPAFLKWWGICFTCEELPEIPIYVGPASGLALKKVVVQAGATYTLPRVASWQRQKFSMEDVRAIASRQKRLCVYGYICYGDIFGNPLRRLKFCETAVNIILGSELTFDWWEGLAPPAYTGTEQIPRNEQAQEHSEHPN